jgi:predicted outer membrane repeat protein
MDIGQPRLPRVLIVCALVAALTLMPGVTARAAGGVVTNCSNDAQFSSLLPNGGTITFNCGSALIQLSSTKTISDDTMIDGGDQITLSGDNARQLFVVSGGAALTLRNIVLTNGSSSLDGGAIYNDGELILENTTIRDSRATASGGAIVSYGLMTIADSLLEGNLAANGGALYPRWPDSRTTIINSVLRNNHTTDTTNGWGGAILAWDGARVTIENSDIYSNTAHFGGGILNYANSILTLQSNTRLRDNHADNSGGGLENDGIATLINVTVSGNSATAGGGLYNSHPIGGNPATATLTNVTFGGNSATIEGGGLWNNGNTTLTNVTFSSNSAAGTGGGLRTSAVALLANVTFTGNSAGVSGGGIYRSSGSVAVKNTIVANSLSGGNCGGSVTNSGFNLSSDTSCGFNHVPNIMLGPLMNNGGPTKTHLPLSGSPAIDFVAVGCPPPATDQRGASRPVGTACDAGAVEYGAILPMLYLPLVRK